MSMTVQTRDLKPGDVILAESPRYNGPTFTVDTKELTLLCPDTYRIVGHWGREGQHPATLSAVPGGKSYLVERGERHVLSEYGTTTCPVELVRANVDDGQCSACGEAVIQS